MGVMRYCRPAVSVVIVNYNGGELVSAAVDSVHQSTVPVEVIVVDNASKDGSFDLLRHRFDSNSRVHFIQNGSNLGFARANNLAMERAKGQYILLLNPDCFVNPDTIERVVAAMEARPQVALAGCLIRNPDGTEQAGSRRAVPTPWRSLTRVLHLDKLFPRHPRFRSFVLTGTPLPKEPVPQEAISGAFMLVRREALDEVGSLDDGYFLHCEDLDWCMRFREAGWKILFVPDAEAVHYKGYCSRTRSGRVLYHLHKGMIRFYRKFFRHQYPAPLMLAVSAGVWLRFLLLAAATWGRRACTSQPPAMVPESVRSSAESAPNSALVWPQHRQGILAPSHDPSDGVVGQHSRADGGQEISAEKRRTVGSARIDS